MSLLLLLHGGPVTVDPAGPLTSKIELGLGSTWQTEPASITWTDVTPYVMDRTQPIVSQRGASSARGEIDPGQMTLRLKSIGRRFDFTYASGPYFGSLKPGVPIRWTATVAGSSPTAVWYGSVATWPQRSDRGVSFGFVPLTCWDGFDKFSRAKIPRSVSEKEILADSPVAYWRLDEPDVAEPMQDSSGNGNVGSFAEVTLGASPLVVDSGNSMTVANTGGGYGRFTGEPLIAAAGDLTVEAWVQLDRDLTKDHFILVASSDLAANPDRRLYVYVGKTATSPNGEVAVYVGSSPPSGGFGTTGHYSFRGSTRVDDGLPHHVAVVFATSPAVSLYVDGVLETKANEDLVSGWTTGGWRSWTIGNHTKTAASGLGGEIDDVAVFASALSAARILAHYNAGAAPLDEQTADERIAWIADEIDWPANLRDLEVGHTKLGPATFEPGDKVLAYFRLVAASEDAPVFIGKDGKLRSLNRYWRYLDTLATTSQFTFSDQSTGKGYAQFDLDLDDELLVNVARFTRRGGIEQVVEDAASVAEYGEAEKQQSNLLQRTDGEVRALAEWTVATQSTPLPRVPTIRIPLHGYSPSDQALILALDLGYRVTVNRTPQGVGSATSLDFLIDGIRHEANAVSWWTTLYVSPVPQDTVGLLIWGTGAWDDADAVWAY